MKRLASLIALLVAGALFTGCDSHAEKTAERSVSPLIGTWTRDGNTNKGPGNGGPEFTKLTFAADGKLSASYVAGGVGAVIGTSPSVKSENDTYTSTDSSLSIAEGTSHRDYSYRVDGGKLYLTPPGGAGEAAVFSKA